MHKVLGRAKQTNLQTKLGFNVKKDMPGLRGPATQMLYAHGANWLAGKAIDEAKK